MASGRLILQRTTASLRHRFSTARLRLIAVAVTLSSHGVAFLGTGTLALQALRRRVRSLGQILGTGTLTSSAVRQRHRTPGTLTGTGTVTLGPVRRRVVALSLLATGTLTAAANKISGKVRAVAFLGTGTLDQFRQIIRHRFLGFIGAGSLTPGALRNRQRAAAFLGTGTLTVNRTRARSASRIFLGQGLLTLGSQKIAGGPSYLLSLGFETPTTGYEVTPAATSSTAPNPIYATSPAPLVGTQSLRCDSSGGSAQRWAQWTITTSSSTVDAYGVFSFATIPGGNTNIMALRNGATNLATVRVNATTGLLRIFDSGGGTNTVDAIATGTTYSILLKYAKSGTISCEFVAGRSGTFAGSGNKFASRAAANALDVDRIFVGWDAASALDMIADDIRVDDTAIGSNPP